MILEKNNRIILESEQLKVVIEPDMGGKIRSFLSKKKNTEFLYIDSRKNFNYSGYSWHDISGYDECFPTVGPCEYTSGKLKGIQLGDHGLVWDKKWNYKINNDRLFMSVEIPQLQSLFERTCYLEEQNCLRIDYKIKNNSPNDLPFIYCAHLMLKGIANSRIELPKQINKIFNTYSSGNVNFPINTWLDLPLSDASLLNGPFDLKKASGSKFFTDKLSENWAVYRNLDTNEALRIEFDNTELPYIGILVFQGLDSMGDGHFGNEFLLGLEPTSGIGDDLKTCELTNTLKNIASGKSLSFWIKLILE